MYPKRVTIIATVFALLLGGVGVQLIRLQLVQGTVYAELAREGRVWDELIAAPRGRILDCRGEVLACDSASYGLAVVARELPLQGVRLDDIRGIRDSDDPEERKLLRETISRRLAERESAVAALASLSGVERARLAAGLLKALERAIRYGGERVPEPFIFGIDRETWMRLAVLLNPPRRFRGRGWRSRDVAIPGVRCVTRATRTYPQGAEVGHLLGYVSEYNAGEIDTLRAWGRLARGGAHVLRDLATACEDVRVADAVGSSLGRSLDTIQSGEELAELLDTLSADEREQLAGALGPRAFELKLWLERNQTVRLTEGEAVWLRSRGHLTDRRVGRTGVEAAFNESLRGRHGYRVVIRNLAMRDGKPVPELDYLRSERPQPGEDEHLEIDLRLQMAAADALASTGLPGAVVVLEPSTGALRACASRPGFDPEVMVSGSAADVKALLSDPRKPMIARAVSGVYPPGSVFKVLVALAGLEEGVLTKETYFDCHHTYEVDGSTFRCMANPGHGTIALPLAITASCNIYFYRAVQRIGAERLLHWARALGFASRTRLDIGGEAPGHLPVVSPGHDMARKTLVQVGIGQGPVTATPLQVAQLMAAVANGGPSYEPRMVKAPRRALSVVSLKPQTRAALLEGMTGTVHDVRGTAHDAFFTPLPETGKAFVQDFPDIKIASKTGTAERRGGDPHAWFAGFAPARNPEIAFAVIVEGGGHGGDTAAPVAARVLAEYFRMSRPAEGGAPDGSR